MIKDLSTAGALPALEKMFLFAGQRQRLIAHNIANIDTPNFRGVDVDPRSFQQSLSRALDERREINGGVSGELDLSGTDEVRMVGGQMQLVPNTHTDGVLFQDRNHRDLERLMQDMVENATMFRVASDLMRKNQSLIRGAIAERVI
ncbi:MAG: flagellar basal body rod protein FlgB [Phycisphaerales bacterium JB047]